MVLESCLAMQSWVHREFRRGLSMHPWGAPVLRISVADVLLPTLTTWGQPVRKSRIQLQREVFSHRWERAVWSTIEIASSVALFGWYANCSGSRVSGIMVLM